MLLTLAERQEVPLHTGRSPIKGGEELAGPEDYCSAFKAYPVAIRIQNRCARLPANM
jgi:hypothetical protein